MITYIIFLFSMSGYGIMAPRKHPDSSFLLEYLITVSDSHPSFEEADYGLIQEC